MGNLHVPKPQWLRKKISLRDQKPMETLLADRRVHTICEEAMCPNIGECFSQNVATFMILGTICTRACTFCAVSRGVPLALNPYEPENIANTVKHLGLRHVVITSSTRDDLNDGGAEHFCKTVNAIKSMDDTITVELLIPDMKENALALQRVANSGAEIIGHNIETVPRLYHVRKGSDYERSLRVLKQLSDLNPAVSTKSGIMLGFGERDDEVMALMQDLLDANCKYLSIGQYLAPSSKYEPVVEYAEPKRFEYLRNRGMEMGFKYIKSSPYTRSSYMAHEYLEG
ncbi:MAG TPA: lipoyl synthase [Sulfuricurvum sp.]|nr:MAG: lipoyl synthase [Campylobacterales bacterium 16-40-21]OZA03845.1 MAG: lipoyl synthase [Sulfuricurvum sp. 17-40-25]HQS65635.1 lipoyl synthase [Sulfuricurvum sp.]HQT36141.1 lipoyl synthase [Sulfuricurvum sp.]